MSEEKNLTDENVPEDENVEEEEKVRLEHFSSSHYSLMQKDPETGKSVRWSQKKPSVVEVSRVMADHLLKHAPKDFRIYQGEYPVPRIEGDEEKVLDALKASTERILAMIEQTAIRDIRFDYDDLANRVAERVIAQMNGESVPTAVDTTPPLDELDSEVLSDLSKRIDRLIEAGKITITGNWLHYDGRKFNGRKNIIEYLKEEDGSPSV